MDKEVTVDTRVKCNACLKIYANKQSLKKHIKRGRCKGNSDQIVDPIKSFDLKEIMTNLREMHKEMREEIRGEIREEMQQMKQQLSVIQPHSILNQNQNLNVICFGQDDDLLDILTKQTSKKQALTFIKNCAFARLAGDCQLLQRIYFPLDLKPAIMYKDKRKTQFVYYDERSRQVVEKDKTMIAKRLANVLRNCYLKSSECLKNSETGKFIDVSLHHPELPQSDESDRQSWEQTIYRFTDIDYLLKIIKHLTIPYENDFT
jgi:hypothetical protein